MGGADQWHEDGDGFRKGSWFLIVEDPGGFTVTHDDLNDYSYYYRPDCRDLDTLKPGQTDYHARATVHDFLTWHAATYPPALTEPTKDGYIGTLASEYGTNHHVYRYADNYGHAYRLVGLAGGSEARTLSWGTVLQAGTFTAVTS